MKWRTGLPIVAVLVLTGTGFVRNRSVTADLRWPAVDAQFREVASAQTILDQGFGPDSSYHHEFVWYNPLTSIFLAGTARVTSVPLHILAPRLGPYINVAAPLAFLLLLLWIADVGVAAAGTATFLVVWSGLFLDIEAPGYPAWLLPSHLGQVFFYLTLVATFWARRAGRPDPVRYGFVGVLLGLTFLVHTAPAVLLGGILTVLLILDLKERRHAFTCLAAWSFAVVCAVLVSLPFLYFIGGFYHFHLVNLLPGVGVYDRLDPNALAETVLEHLTPAVLLATAGGLLFAWRRRHDAVGRALLAWLALCLAFMAYSTVRVFLDNRGLALPAVVPQWHFVFYFHAWLGVGLGLGLGECSRWLAARFAPARAARVEPLVLAALTIFVVAAHLPGYLRHAEKARAEALGLARVLPADAFAWIQEHTRPTDVFLSTDHMSLFVITPAGRKVVANDRYFSSPYVDWRQRDLDRKRLFELLARGDRSGFEDLARRCSVSYVIWSDHVSDWTRGTLGMHPAPRVTSAQIGRAGLPKVFEGDAVAIYATRVAAAPSLASWSAISARDAGASGSSRAEIR
jgi:hypothetical protein